MRYPWRNIRMRMSETANATQRIRIDIKVACLKRDPMIDVRIMIPLSKRASKHKAGIKYGKKIDLYQ